MTVSCIDAIPLSVAAWAMHLESVQRYGRAYTNLNPGPKIRPASTVEVERGWAHAMCTHVYMADLRKRVYEMLDRFSERTAMLEARKCNASRPVPGSDSSRPDPSSLPLYIVEFIMWRLSGSKESTRPPAVSGGRVAWFSEDGIVCVKYIDAPDIWRYHPAEFVHACSALMRAFCPIPPVFDRLSDVPEPVLAFAMWQSTKDGPLPFVPAFFQEELKINYAGGVAADQLVIAPKRNNPEGICYAFSHEQIRQLARDRELEAKYLLNPYIPVDPFGHAAAAIGVDNENVQWTPTQEGPVTDKPEIVKTLKADAADAAWRTAGSQFVKLTRDPLVALLSRHLAPEDEAVRNKVAAFLQTEIGTAMLASLLSVALTAAPQTDIAARMARELRVRSMAGAGDLIAEVVMGPLREVMATYLHGVPEAAAALAAAPAIDAPAARAAAVDPGIKVKVEK